MNNINIWTLNANIQILTALVLIVVFLMYIAFKLSESGVKKPSKKSA